jgi:hypothetical protein
VGLRLHRAQWTAVTAWQVAALAALTVAMIGAGVLLSRAGGAVDRIAHADAQPDWLTDAVALGLRGSGRLRHQADRASDAVRWTDDHLVRRIRSHPVLAAALLADALALPYVAAKILVERYPPALILLSFALPAAAFFALIMLAGRYLRVVAPRSDATPTGTSVAVVGCVVGTVLFALHDSLLPQHQTAAELNALLFGGAITGGIASLGAHLALRRVRAARPPASRR